MLEETGCKVKLTGVLPIYSANGGNIERLMVRFTAEVIEEDIKIDPEEILDVQWIDIEKLKNMTREELRAYDVNMQYIKDFEDGKIYPLEIFNDTQFFE